MITVFIPLPLDIKRKKLVCLPVHNPEQITTQGLADLMSILSLQQLDKNFLPLYVSPDPRICIRLRGRSTITWRMGNTFSLFSYRAQIKHDRPFLCWLQYWWQSFCSKNLSHLLIAHLTFSTPETTCKWALSIIMCLLW